MQASKIIAGQLLLLIIVAGFLVFLTDGVTKYNPSVPAEYNESFVKLQNRLADINSTLGATRDDLEIDTTGGFFGSNPITDFLGFFFNAGYKAIKTVTAVIEFNFDLIDVTVDNVLPGAFGDVVRVVLILLVLVVILVGILIRSIIKGDSI